MCNIRHTLTYKLSHEYEVNITLHMIVFMMNKVNTLKVSTAPSEYNLSHISEMDCYFQHKG